MPGRLAPCARPCGRAGGCHLAAGAAWGPRRVPDPPRERLRGGAGTVARGPVLGRPGPGQCRERTCAQSAPRAAGLARTAPAGQLRAGYAPWVPPPEMPPPHTSHEAVGRPRSPAPPGCAALPHAGLPSGSQLSATCRGARGGGHRTHFPLRAATLLEQTAWGPGAQSQERPRAQTSPLPAPPETKRGLFPRGGRTWVPRPAASQAPGQRQSRPPASRPRRPLRTPPSPQTPWRTALQGLPSISSTPRPFLALPLS